MSEKSTGRGTTDEEATGNKSTDRHTDSLSIRPLLANLPLRYWLPPVLWMGLIFILSAQPSLPQHPDNLLDLVLKKAAHLVEYGILAFLLWRALRQGGGVPSRPAWVAAFLVSVLYAASDEYHQTFVPGRHGKLMDVGIDTVGALIALLVVGSLGRKREQADTSR